MNTSMKQEFKQLFSFVSENEKRRNPGLTRQQEKVEQLLNELHLDDLNNDNFFLVEDSDAGNSF